MRRGYSIATRNRPSVYLGQPRRMRAGDLEEAVSWNVTGEGRRRADGKGNQKRPNWLSVIFDAPRITNPDEDDEQNSFHRWQPSWI